MTPNEYQALASRTTLPPEQIQESIDRMLVLSETLHAAMGLCTEAGELQDALKKHIYYGKPLDTVNIKEELGDLLWYIALMCNQLDTTLESVMEHNIRKLRNRYVTKFTAEEAVNRDLEAEREILEDKLPATELFALTNLNIAISCSRCGIPTKVIGSTKREGALCPTCLEILHYKTFK